MKKKIAGILLAVLAVSAVPALAADSSDEAANASCCQGGARYAGCCVYRGDGYRNGCCWNYEGNSARR